jgi:nitrite reductase (NO-forming)
VTAPVVARGAADRVRISHGQTRTTLRLALAFIGTAAVATGAGGARWLPLHLFLAGGVVLAISGVSLMLTVTWSAAPAPSDRLAAAQRLCIAFGAAGITIAREAELADGLLAAAGIVYACGIALLGVLLVTTIRRGVERRFDVAVASYVCALVAGSAGIAIGIAMAVGSPSADLRAAHVTLNLLGLVGLVIGGTMPYFAATVGRSRMGSRATRRRLAGSLCWQASTLALAVVGLGTGARALAVAGLVGYTAGVAGVLSLLPRPARRQLEWAGPRLLALWAGGAWWALAVGASAADASRRGAVVFGDRWLLVLVVAAYAQILWGSLAYLLPMLRGGGHERLAEGFATTRSWVGLVAANGAGAGLALQRPAVAAIAGGVWVFDAAWRAIGVGTRAPRARPRAFGGAGRDRARRACARVRRA